jgi:hypothetical protein
MRIDKRMNLVIPIVNEKDVEIAFVHSTPISTEVFSKYYLVMGKAFARIWAEGLGYVGGARIADKILRTVAEEMGIWDNDPTGVANGLVAEMQRLTNVIIAVPDRGWQLFTLHDAKKQDLFSEDELTEVDALICFFTLAWHLHRKAQFAQMTGTQLNMLGARIESLSCTELVNSLQKSKSAANTGATAAA